MKKISSSERKKITDAYKKFYLKAIEVADDNKLSIDEKKAIGQKVFEGLLSDALYQSRLSESEKQIYKSEIEEIIKEDCIDLLSETEFTYSKNGFIKKQN
jgi:hypothetical protein